MEQPPLQPLSGRKDRTPLILACIVGGVTVLMLATVFFMMGGSETPSLRFKGGSAFGKQAQGSAAPAPLFPGNPQSSAGQPQAVPGQFPAAPGQPQPGSDSLAFVTNTDGAGFAGGGVSAAQRAKEAQFIAQYDGMIRQYGERLRGIGQRHWQKNAVVKQVDADFAGLPRYMAIKRRYQQDRDLYQWARDVTALPEVRTIIKKHLANPECWKVAVDMALEALKQPPPAPIYKEIQRFMLSDPAMRDMTKDVANEATKHIGPAMVSMATSGKDITPLKQVISDIGVGKKTTP